jgi:hypothetical protein
MSQRGILRRHATAVRLSTYRYQKALKGLILLPEDGHGAVIVFSIPL